MKTIATIAAGLALLATSANAADPALVSNNPDGSFTVQLHQGNVKSGERCTGFFLDGQVYAVSSVPGTAFAPNNPLMGAQLIASAEAGHTVTIYPGGPVQSQCLAGQGNAQGFYTSIGGTN